METDYLTDYITIEAVKYRLKIPIYVEYVGEQVHIIQDKYKRSLYVTFRRSVFKNEIEKCIYFILNKTWIKFKNKDAERAVEVLRMMEII